MSKKTWAQDQFLLVLLAVVFAAIAVIFIRSRVIPWAALGVTGRETPSQLLQQLEQTTGDEGTADFEQLKTEAAGL